jgi:23S rRNA pseudouridine1911/1915/1917 synthase
MTRFEFQVEESARKERLEDYLCEKFPNLSKMYLREIVKEEKCEVNGTWENRGHRLKQNDFIEIEVDLQRETAMMPENVPLEIIFEDKEILIVNKPAEMLVHPTHRDKNGTLLNALSYYLNSGSESKIVRPGLVHRLDKQTSGLIVIAKTARAHRILSEQFRRKLVEKKYLALVEGIVKVDSGTIEAPVGRFAERKIWDVKADGKHSETRFNVRERFFDSTLLELEPVTGRTNQLRIHCAHVGHPILGDTERGGREFSRLCLHAFQLSFWHPNGNQFLKFETEFEKFD